MCGAIYSALWPVVCVGSTSFCLSIDVAMFKCKTIPSRHCFFMHILIDEKNDPIPDKFNSSNNSALLLCSPGTWLPWREDAPERRWGFHKRCKYLKKTHTDAFTFLESTRCSGIALRDQCRGWPVSPKRSTVSIIKGLILGGWVANHLLNPPENMS